MTKKIILVFVSAMFFMQGGEINAMELKSNAFGNGKKIPIDYTCDGKNISPALNWQDIPEQAKSLVLIMEDPDAPNGTWDHWVLYNIPVRAKGLDTGTLNFPKGTQIGKNSWNKQEYGGPCPPSGVHHYHFNFYALDTVLDLPAGATKAELKRAMHGHVLSRTELMGQYGH